MNTYALKHSLKKATPEFVLSYYYNRQRKQTVNIEFANFILDSAVEFSRYRNGDTGSFDRRLKNLIINSNNECNSIIQDILTAFMPDYEKDLYHYYKNQEYLIFYRFLSYPFSGNLNSYIVPYKNALARFETNDILDYGSGIPYGLIYSLLRMKKSIQSITLIDLDLIHLEFAQFVINKIAPEIRLNIYKITDTDTFPEIEGKYNFFFGQDIFEHLSDPLKNLKELIKHSKERAVCYFEFDDHGEKKYQHITPNVKFLADEMIKLGYRSGEKLFGLTEFVRGME